MGFKSAIFTQLFIWKVKFQQLSLVEIFIFETDIFIFKYCKHFRTKPHLHYKHDKQLLNLYFFHQKTYIHMKKKQRNKTLQKLKFKMANAEWLSL